MAGILPTWSVWWQTVSASALPQADLVNDLGNKGYLVFGLILFVWELLPTTLLVGFFRVHRPPQDLVGLPSTTSRFSGEGWTLGILAWGPGIVMGHIYIYLHSCNFPHTPTEHQSNPQRAGFWLPFLLL